MSSTPSSAIMGDVPSSFQLELEETLATAVIEPSLLHDLNSILWSTRPSSITGSFTEATTIPPRNDIVSQEGHQNQPCSTLLNSDSKFSNTHTKCYPQPNNMQQGLQQHYQRDIYGTNFTPLAEQRPQSIERHHQMLQPQNAWNYGTQTMNSGTQFCGPNTPNLHPHMYRFQGSQQIASHNHLFGYSTAIQAPIEAQTRPSCLPFKSRNRHQAQQQISPSFQPFSQPYRTSLGNQGQKPITFIPSTEPMSSESSFLPVNAQPPSVPSSRKAKNNKRRAESPPDDSFGQAKQPRSDSDALSTPGQSDKKGKQRADIACQRCKIMKIKCKASIGAACEGCEQATYLCIDVYQGQSIERKNFLEILQQGKRAAEWRKEIELLKRENAMLRERQKSLIREPVQPNVELTDEELSEFSEVFE